LSGDDLQALRRDRHVKVRLSEVEFGKKTVKTGGAVEAVVVSAIAALDRIYGWEVAGRGNASNEYVAGFIGAQGESVIVIIAAPECGECELASRIEGRDEGVSDTVGDCMSITVAADELSLQGVFHRENRRRR